MKEIRFSNELSCIPESDIYKLSARVNDEIQKMNHALTCGYDDTRASLNLVSDEDALKKIKELISKKRELNPACIVVVGIGGSNLGTIAVQEAILGKLFNQLEPDVRILYADTVDSDLIEDIKQIIETMLNQGKNVLINGVSKSGGTTETMANFKVLVDLVQKYRSNVNEYVIVTTDKDSKFWNYANKHGFDVLEIPKKVGGRFSVFSPAGLFPLGIIGINIDTILKGAADMRNRCLSSDILQNPASLSATLKYIHHKKGINIDNKFLFSTDLESFGKWYRQLMGESIGKEYNINNEQIFEGITPTVSIGSTDLHSMAQLYLGGPYDKFTTFISVEQNKSQIEIPDDIEFSSLVEGINGKYLQNIMDAILQGTKIAFKKGNRPFSEIFLPDKSEHSIGQLLQLMMMEMMYLGALLNVDPFNQPNVEEYKVETRRILTSEL